MILQLLPDEFAISQLPDILGADLSRPFTFLARTDEEISLVCPVDFIPENAIKKEAGYTCMRIQGVLDFSLVGILSGIAACLAEKSIPIFAISTYNTDYLLIPSAHLGRARSALSAKGYQIN